MARAPAEAIRIPRRRTSLIGRGNDVDAIARLLRKRELVTVTGPVGCGKTRLAIAVAQRVRQQFIDGVFFADLSDVTDPAMVALRVQQALDLEVDAGGSADRAIVDFIAQRRVLLVLDNCEQVVGAVVDLVEAILDAGISARILATSRLRLEVEGEEVYLLHPLALPGDDTAAGWASSPAVVLFTERLGGDQLLEQFEESQRAAISRICAAADGLPLSLELAASRARIFQLHEVAASMADNPMALGHSTRSLGRPRNAATLRDSIDSSHSLLTDDERLTHRRLSALPPGFTVDAAVVACSTQTLTPDRVSTAMTGLVNHSLLEADGAERPDGPTMFRQLVAIRAHAAERLATADEGAAVRAAVVSWVVRVVTGGPRIGQQGQARWYQQLDDNRRTITSAMEAAIADGPSDDILLTVSRLVVYWMDRMMNADGMRLTGAAHAAVTPTNGAFAGLAAAAAYASILAANQEVDTVRPVLEQAIAELCSVGPDE